MESGKKDTRMKQIDTEGEAKNEGRQGEEGEEGKKRLYGERKEKMRICMKIGEE